MDNTSQSDRSPEREGDDDFISTLIRNAGPLEEPPSAHYEAVLAATGAAWQRKVRRRRLNRLVFAMAASALVAAALFGLNTTRHDPAPMRVARADIVLGEVEVGHGGDSRWAPLSSSGDELSRGSRLRSGPDGAAGLLLGDDLSLRLAADTELLIEDLDRIRLFTGAVYVDTGSDAGAESRIEIVTPAGRVWDVGTQFEVRYLTDTLTLRVREGRVILEREDEQSHGLAGQQIDVDSLGRVTRTAVDTYSPEWQWVQAVAPAPYAHDLTVRELLEWVARETGRSIQFAEPGLATRTSRTVLHGNPHRLRPMEALAVMLATTDLDYTIVGEGEILVSGGSR